MYCMSVWATTCLRRPAVPPLLAAVHPRLAAAEIRLLKKGTPAFTLTRFSRSLNRVSCNQRLSLKADSPQRVTQLEWRKPCMHTDGLHEARRHR